MNSPRNILLAIILVLIAGYLTGRYDPTIDSFWTIVLVLFTISIATHQIEVHVSYYRERMEDKNGSSNQ